MNMTLRPIGTEFDDVIERPKERIIVTKRVVAHEPDENGMVEVTREVGRVLIPKMAPRPSEHK